MVISEISQVCDLLRSDFVINNLLSFVSHFYSILRSIIVVEEKLNCPIFRLINMIYGVFHVLVISMIYIIMILLKILNTKV